MARRASTPNLREQGERHSRKRIARLMRGLVSSEPATRRGGPITTRRDQEVRPAPDLVDRNFAAQAPNRLWVADITYVPTAAGFLYLAGGARRLQPRDRRLGHGQPSALGVGAGRSRDGRQRSAGRAT